MNKPAPRWRRALLVAAGLAGGGGVATLVLLGFLATDAGNRVLLRLVQTDFAQRGLFREGHLEASGLSTDLTHGLGLTDVVLRDGTGRPVLAARYVGVSYDLVDFLLGRGRRLHVSDVLIVGPTVTLAVDADGQLDLARIFASDAPASDEPTQLPFAIDVDRVRIIGGSFAMDGAPTVRGVNATAALHGAGPRIDVDGLVAQGEITGPFRLPIAAAGELSWRGAGLAIEDLHALVGDSALVARGGVDVGDAVVVDVDVDVTKLHLPDVHRFAGPIGLVGDVTGDLHAKGTLDALAIVGDLHAVAPARADVGLTAIVAATTPGTPWLGVVEARGLHVEDLVGTVPKVVALDGRLDARGRGTTWPGDLVAEGRFVGDTQQIDTLTLDHVDAPLRLEGGVLSWTDAAATSGLGPLVLDGQLDLVRGALDTGVRGPLDLAGLQQFGLDGTAGGGELRLRVTGDVFADDLPLAADGRIAWAPLVYGDDVRFERAEGTLRWRMRAGIQHADGALVLTDGLVYGHSVAQVDLPDLGVELAVDGDLHVGGTATVTDVANGATYGVATAAGPWRAHLPPGAEPSFHAELAVGATSATGGFGGTGGTAVVDLAQGVVRADVHLVDHDRDLLVVAPTYTIATAALSAPSLVVSPTPRQIWRSDGPIAAIVAEGGVREAHLALVSDLGRLVVWGDLARDAPLLGHIEAEGFELDALAELFPERYTDYAGKVDLVADVAGTADAPVFDATVHGRGLFVPGVSRWLDVDGTFAGDPRGVTARADVGVAGAPLGTVTGRVPVHLDLDDPHLDLDAALDVAVDVTEGPLARVGDLVAGLPTLPTGDVRGRFVASGTLRDPVFATDLDFSLVAPGWRDHAEVVVGIERRGEVLSVDVALAEGRAPRATMVGTARTRVGAWIAYGLGEGPAPDASDADLIADAMSMRVDTRGWPLGSLMALGGYDPRVATGAMVGGFDVTGTLTRPVLDGALEVVDARVHDVPFQRLSVDVAPGRGGYAVDAVAAIDGETLTVHGRAPLSIDVRQDWSTWSDDDLDLAIEGALPLSLAHLADARLRGDGRAALRGRLTGRLDAPWPDLDLDLHDGAIAARGLGVTFRDVAVVGHLDPTRAKLTTLSAESVPTDDLLEKTLGRNAAKATTGRIDGRLDLGLAHWAPTTVDGWLALDRTWLAASPKLAARISGRVDAERLGTEGPIDVFGDLAVDEARYAYDADASLNRPVALDRRITVHRTGVAPPVAAVGEDEAWLGDDWRVDIAVELARAVELEGTLVAVEDYGVVGAGLSRADFEVRVDSRDLHLRLNRGHLGLFGEVEVVDGDVVVLGRPFAVQDSRVAFLGDPYEPQLAVTAVASVQGAGIDLDVSGTPSRPKIALSSEDLANDPTQILTALVTGQLPENLASGAGDAVFGAVGGLLLSNLTGMIGDLGSVATVQADGTIHVVGRLGPKVRLEGVLDPLPDNNQNRYAAQVEVSPLPHVLFRGVFGDEQQWADLYWDLRF